MKRNFSAAPEGGENKMGTMPTKRLLVTMSLPLMASMLVQALYNIVDSIFIAQISEAALTAVSLAFPMQMLMIAVAVGTGVGVNSLLSRRLGEKRNEDANLTATNGFFLALLSWLVFAVFGIFFSKLFMSAFTDDAAIVQMGSDYLSICCIFSFGIFGQITAERVLQATGITVYNMITQGVGAILNIILDPIFIFVFKMGVPGAAIATVIGQTAAMLLGIFFNYKKNKLVKISFRKFRPNLRIIGEIYRVGFPSIIMQSIGSFMTIGLNAILIAFSEVAVTVLGVYFKIQSFVFMPVFGMSNALIAIVGYNYGAKNRKRIHETLNFAIFLAVAMMAVGVILFMAIPEPLLLMFKASAEMLAIGVPALRIISVCFIFAGVSISLTSVFQAVGNGILSLIISFVRQLIVVLPATYLLARFAGLTYCWWSFPIAEALSLALTVAFYFRVKKKYFDRLESNPLFAVVPEAVGATVGETVGNGSENECGSENGCGSENAGESGFENGCGEEFGAYAEADLSVVEADRDFDKKRKEEIASNDGSSEEAYDGGVAADGKNAFAAPIEIVVRTTESRNGSETISEEI